MIRNASARDYYDCYPNNQHTPGDIWIGLPDFGLITGNSIAGVIITPSCDLAKRKVETITYIPVIPIKHYFASVVFYSEVKNKINSWANNLNKKIELPESALLLKNAEINIYIELFEEEKKRNVKKSNDFGRIICGLNLLKDIVNLSCSSVNYSNLESLWGTKDKNKMISSIIRNNYQSDIHYMPKDYQDSIEWSGTKEHSIALFRYPITIPIDILDIAANITGVEIWNGKVRELAPIMPVCKGFIDKIPVKVTRLKSPYIINLLTRYAALYIRMGAPDFFEHRISELTEEIEEELK